MGYAIADMFSNTPSYADMAAKSEKQRQALINLGQQQIDAVYGGGTVPFYNKATGAFSPNKSYYSFGDKGFQPYYNPQVGGGGFSKQGKPLPGAGLNGGTQGAIKGAEYGSIIPGTGTVIGSSIGGTIGAAKDGDWLGALSGGGTSILKSLFGGSEDTPMEKFNKKEKKGLLYGKTDQTFQGFTPDFYDKRAQAYVDFALPQLAKQYRDTQSQIGFGLANRGLVGGSAARGQYSNLNRTNAEGVQNIVDTGRGQAQALQRQVEDSKNALISQLYQSADPARGVQQAISSASGFQSPSTFAPIANTFSGLINQYYANQILNPRQGGGYAAPAAYGGGLNLGALPTNYTV